MKELKAILLILLILIAIIALVAGGLYWWSDWKRSDPRLYMGGHLVDFAARHKLNYEKALDQAMAGNSSALAELLIFSNKTIVDAAGSECHGEVLWHLLKYLGDDRFSSELRKHPEEVRNRVTVLLDFGAGKNWQAQFPKTFNLGKHDEDMYEEEE